MPNEILAGNIASKTNWLGLTTAMIGYLQMPDTQRMLSKLLGAWWGPETIEFILASLTIACGLGAIWVRNQTNESIAAKGQRMLQ